MRDSYMLYMNKLDGEYREVFWTIHMYCSTLEVDDSTREERLTELLDVFLQAQEEKKPVEKIVGTDTERFCENFSRQFSTASALASLADYMVGFAWLVFLDSIVEAVFQEGVSFWQRTTDISSFLCALAVGMAFSRPFGMAMRWLLRRYRKLSKRAFYLISGLESGLALAVFICIGALAGDYPCPAWISMAVSGIYLLVYYPFARKRRNKIPKYSLSDQAGELIEQEIKGRYEQINKKRRQKGKAALTQKEYLEKLKRESRREKGYDIFFFVFPLLLVAVSLPFVEFEGAADRYWFIGITLAVEYAVMTPFVRFNRRLAKKKREWIAWFEE